MKFLIQTREPHHILMKLKEFEGDVEKKSNRLVSASSKKVGDDIELTLLTPMDNPVFEHLFKAEIAEAVRKIDKTSKVVVVKE